MTNNSTESNKNSDSIFNKNMTTDTPRTDAAIWRLTTFSSALLENDGEICNEIHCASHDEAECLVDLLNELTERAEKAEADVKRLTKRMKEAEELIQRGHDGWKKARKAHLETCKNAQTEIDKLHTENVCLQGLIQEFYEWTRRDYPTESEVREIMDRYYNLLNK